ncbi:hypothetical protein Tco_0223615 [Tanacetum coccineum]
MLDSKNITFKERNIFIPIPIANYIDCQEFPSNNDSNNPEIQLQTTNNSVTSLNSLNYTSLDDYNLEYDEEQGDSSTVPLELVPNYKIKIIPGPAGIVQTAKLHKLADTREGGEESVMSTQEYIRKVIEDVGEDDDFMCVSWLSVLDYVNVDGGIMTGCFGDVKKFLKNVKLEKVVVRNTKSVGHFQSCNSLST